MTADNYFERNHLVKALEFQDESPTSLLTSRLPFEFHSFGDALKVMYMAVSNLIYILFQFNL